MPFEVILNSVPAGYAASVNEQGEVAVIVREFVSSENGDLLISRLEGLPSELISMLPPNKGIFPSTIHHMLAIVRRDKSATLYINEPRLVSTILYRGKRTIQAGDLIFDDDILDIERLSFEGVEIPNDAGIVIIFSAGWRKGLFYDLLPFSDATAVRDYDLDLTLGRYFSYLNFQHLFKVTDEQWNALFREQWFPFVTLKTATRKQILEHAKNNLPVDRLLDAIAAEVKESADEMLERWKIHPLVEPSFVLIERAVERFLQQDYISATSILYTQIEGVMQRVYFAHKPRQRVKATEIASHVVQLRPESYHEYSLLLPLRFNQYLQEVYFAGFDPGQPATISRNSIAHGVADPEGYSLKATVIGLLTLDQVFFFLPPSSDLKQDKTV
jgi:hypothetical protein